MSQGIAADDITSDGTYLYAVREFGNNNLIKIDPSSADTSQWIKATITHNYARGNGIAFVPGNQPPTCSITMNILNPEVGQSITFNSGASDPSATVSWVFGDGGTGTGITATHAYATAGRKSVTATVTNSNGSGTCVGGVTIVDRQRKIRAIVTWKDYGKEHRIEFNNVMQNIQ